MDSDLDMSSCLSLTGEGSATVTIARADGGCPEAM